MSASAQPPPEPNPADDTDPWYPHGLALLAYMAGDRDAAVEVHYDDGSGAHPPDLEPVAPFLREPADLWPWERAALDRARGRVLDVGAGGGTDVLVLQERGHAVVGLDVCPACVEIMGRRGVRDARCGTLADIDDGPYDTLLFLMNGIGVAGDLTGLAWILAEAQRLVAPGGRILLDSCDPRSAGMPPGVPDHPDGYPGVCKLSLRFGDVHGPPFWWLYVDDATLARQAARVGWSTEVVHRGDDAVGSYLAQLTRT